MAEFRITPLICAVALRTLPWEMTAWWRVTALAIGKAIMTEIGIAPLIRAVALRTLPWEMTAWWRVTALAIG
jgi:hypothetical protein